MWTEIRPCVRSFDRDENWIMGMVSVEVYFTEWDGMRLLGKDRTYSEDRTLKKVSMLRQQGMTNKRGERCESFDFIPSLYSFLHTIRYDTIRSFFSEFSFAS